MGKSKEKSNGESRPKKTILQDAVDLALCTGAIYGCYIIYGMLQERITTHEYGENKKKFTWSLFLVFFQSVINGLLALFVILYKQETANKVPQRYYAQIGGTYLGAMWASNLSLQYVSFPTQVLAKSCKVIPVMIMNLFYGHRYSLRDYLSMLSLTFGISLFMVFQGNTKHGPANSVVGFALLALSLAFDAYTSPTQEHIMQLYKPTLDQLMLYLNFYAVIFTAAYLIPTGQMVEAFLFLADAPDCILHVMIYSVLSALGQYSILWTLFRFDSLILTVVTTTRKFFSILGSVILFAHPVSLIQWIGVAFVFLGLSAEVYEKYEKKQKKKSILPDREKEHANGHPEKTKKRSTKAT